MMKGQGEFSISDVSQIMKMPSLKPRYGSMETLPLILMLSSSPGKLEQTDMYVGLQKPTSRTT